MAHFYLAAAHKSSGKTSLAVGLTAAFVKKGIKVQPFKKGPDYIDPLWLSRAAGTSCYNLDFFTQTHEEIISTFCNHLEAADIGVIEGNKGLYDGVDVEGTDSNAALATLLGSPVILVIDTMGITRGIAPLIRGYLDFDPNIDIRGVILNKVGGSRHETKLRAALERYTDTRVLGSIGRDSGLEIPERHLGLMPANEAHSAGTADGVISRLADSVTAGIDLDRMVKIAHSAKLPGVPEMTVAGPGRIDADVRIAIAKDAAFGFYYPDDLEAFAHAGAELVPFDTLNDPHLPESDGLFIGGGFPETRMEALSANQSLLGDIRNALANGLPAYAECGGLMYLARSIRWQDKQYPMVAAIEADVIVDDRPRGRGYMRMEETGHCPWPPCANSPDASQTGIPAHEFHYSYLENLYENAEFACRVLRGTGINGDQDGLVQGNLMAGFAHHRNTRANPWVGRFVEFVRQKSA